MNHIILHPVEAPAFELDMVLLVRVGDTPPIPTEMLRCCKAGSVKVMAVTPTDVPCRVTGRIFNGHIELAFDRNAVRPSGVWVHLVGKARTSPPAWERHSRQQFTRNRRTFAKALP